MAKWGTDEVFQTLGCSREGLSSEAVQQRLRRFGPNTVTRISKFQGIHSFLEGLWIQLNLRIFAAIAVIFNDYDDKHPETLRVLGVVYISVLFMVCCYASIESRVDLAIHRLMSPLARKVKVLRNGRWTKEQASVIVPGDVIMIKAWDVVPADTRLLEGDPLHIDQSPLTGEPVEVIKQEGDAVYYGSICEQGESKAVVVATGACISFRNSIVSVASNKDKCLDKILTAILSVSICLTAVAIFVEIVIFAIGRRAFVSGIDSLLVLLIGGIPITLRWTTLNAISKGSHFRHLVRGNKGAMLKRMYVIKEMAEMDVLCTGTSGNFLLNDLTVLRDMIEVFDEGMDASIVILMAARACHTESHDAIDAAILGTLDDPEEVWSGISDVSFQSLNPTGNLTTITFTDNEGEVHQVCKGAAQEILNLAHNKKAIEQRVFRVADYFKNRGWQSVAVAHQVLCSIITDQELKDNNKNRWNMIGLVPLYNIPRCDSAETIRRASDVGINVKIITDNKLEIAKEVGRSLGMNTNMYPVFSLLGQLKDDKSVYTSPITNLIENADGFSNVTQELKCKIIKQLQSRGHICGMTGHSGIDAAAMKKADIGIALATASDSVRRASDIVLTEPGLDVIIRTVLTCRKISKRIKAFSTFTIASTIHTLLSFLLFALVWKFDVPPVLLLIFVILNDALNRGTYASYDVKSSSTPDRWKLGEVLRTGIFLGVYFASTTVLFFLAANSTDIFKTVFGVASLKSNYQKLGSAMFLQLSNSSQLIVLFTQSRRWSRVKQNKVYVFCLLTSQMIAALIAVYASDDNYWPGISGIGWGWVGVIWLYNLFFYIVLVIIKLFIQRVWLELASNKLYKKAYELIVEQTLVRSL